MIGSVIHRKNVFDIQLRGVIDRENVLGMHLFHIKQ